MLDIKKVNHSVWAFSQMNCEIDKVVIKSLHSIFWLGCDLPISDLPICDLPNM